MDDQDKKAKERARRQAQSGSAARPGAEAVKGDEAARIDERIASKQEAAGDKKVAAAAAVEKEESTTASADMAAKSRARRTTSEVKPGAYAEKTIPAELNQLESDIAAKNRARRSTSTTTERPSELNQLERDIVAKNRARRGTSTEAAVAPGAHPQLNEIEDRVAAKTRRAGSTTSSAAAAAASTPGAHAQLDEMESRISAKARRGGPTPGARPQLNDLEDRVAAKTRRASTETTAAAASMTPGVQTELNDLEERIASKTGRPAPRSPQLDELEGQIAAKTRAARNSQGTDVSRLDERISAKIDNEIATQRREAPSGGANPTLVSLPGEEPQGYESFDDDAMMKEEKEKMAGEAPPQDTAPVGTTSRGIINQPDVEFGQYDTNGQGLAVAVAVTPEEEDAFIPAAIEYDPDSKPPLYKNRRFRLYGIVASIMLAVIVAGVSVGIVASGSDNAPTMAPTSYRSTLGIQDQIIAVVGEDAMISDDPKKPTPQKRAMDWIIDEDPMQLPPDAANLIQRYLLAVVYLSTIELGPWLSCNPPEEGETDDCMYMKLVQVFPNMVYEEIEWGRWLSGHHECNWAGIFCDEADQIRAFESCKYHFVVTPYY
jgi:hypothetical protein